MRRRDFVMLAACGALLRQRAARAQSVRVIGFLRSTSAVSSANLVASFRQGLTEQGFVEGQELVIQYAFADGEPNRLPGLAAELVRQQPAAIVAGGNEALVAARDATTQMPIVFALGDNPVKLGFVGSFNHPGGNITGVSFETTDIVRKRMQFLRELMPRATKVGYLMNLNDVGSEAEARELEAAAQSDGVEVLISKAASEAEIDAAFDLFARDRAETLVVGSGAFFFAQRERLAALAARHAIPAIYNLRNFVTAGGLMSYGPNIADAYRLVGIYVGRILRGVAPGDLPVMQPTKFELAVNLKAAKALGLDIPSSVLVRADSKVRFCADIGGIETPQSSSLVPERAVLSFLCEAREAMTVKRRTFIALFGGAAAAWPLAAHGQKPGRVRRVGIVMPYAKGDSEYEARVRAFKEELAKLGWTEGGNVVFEEHWTTDNMDRVRAEAAALVASSPDVIVTTGGRIVPVFMRLTRSIPIVLPSASDPVGVGYAQSLARPGGNITGFTGFQLSMLGKSLDILKQIAPAIVRVALIYNPDNPNSVVYRHISETSSASLAIELVNLPVHGLADIDRAVTSLADRGNSGIFFLPDLTISALRDDVVALVARRRVPAIYSEPFFVKLGGLAFYGADRMEGFRRSAGYVDRILRGEKPGDLPFQQSTKYELIINRTAAKTLGLELSPALLALADEVIE